LRRSRHEREVVRQTRVRDRLVVVDHGVALCELVEGRRVRRPEDVGCLVVLEYDDNDVLERGDGRRCTGGAGTPIARARAVSMSGRPFTAAPRI
jgi:hypothetical protein